MLPCIVWALSHPDSSCSGNFDLVIRYLWNKGLMLFYSLVLSVQGGLPCTCWVNQIWFDLSANSLFVTSHCWLTYLLTSTRGNISRFSSAEEENQSVARSQTSCWRSRGWWAKMRARGTSTFIIRSETCTYRHRSVTAAKTSCPWVTIHESQLI